MDEITITTKKNKLEIFKNFYTQFSDCDNYTFFLDIISNLKKQKKEMCDTIIKDYPHLKHDITKLCNQLIFPKEYIHPKYFGNDDHIKCIKKLLKESLFSEDGKKKYNLFTLLNLSEKVLTETFNKYISTVPKSADIVPARVGSTPSEKYTPPKIAHIDSAPRKDPPIPPPIPPVPPVLPIPPIPPVPPYTEIVERMRKSIASNMPHKGIYNESNMCYMNAFLQLLSYVPEFVQELGEKTPDDINDYLLSFFYNLYSDDVYITKNMDIFKILYEKDINISKQEDSHEYLLNFLQKLGIDNSYFNFTINEEKTCIHGAIDGEEETKKYTEKDNILGLVIKNSSDPTTVGTLIYENSHNDDGGEKIERCKTDDGGSNGPYKQKYSYTFEDTNKYLIIHLRRFKTNREKISIPIMVDDILGFGDTYYYIYGSIVHIGASIKSGHYKFFKINDTNIIEYNDKDVRIHERSNFGSIECINNNSYLLIYKKVIATGGNVNYKEKYLKYKTKYLKLKKNI